MNSLFLKTIFRYVFAGALISSVLVTSCEEDKKETGVENTDNKSQQNTTTPEVTSETEENPPIETSTTIALTEAQQILNLVNKERSQRGLKALVLNNELNKAALEHSQDMASNNFFSHTGSDQSDFSLRTKKAQYTGFARAENIATGHRTAQAVHDGWMRSDGHRANILLSDITDMGIGKSGRLWTQVFGRTR